MNNEMQNTEKLLQDFFHQEKKIEAGKALEIKIQEALRKKRFKRTKETILALAAIIILAFVITTTFYRNDEQNHNIKQSQIIYQDEDFILYVQE